MKIRLHQLLSSSLWSWQNLVVAILILGAFLGLRWYDLDKSLVFHGDTGRDFLVLQEWLQTYKPPMLGPQTSVISFNQSPFYFYSLFPIFVLSQQSFFSSNVTLSIFYVVLFGLGLWVIRKDKTLQIPFLTLALLMTVHPEFVLQHRAVWNPSFVPAFLILSWYSFIQLRKEFKVVWVGLFGLGAAASVALSYSLIPTILAFLLVGAVLYRFKVIQLIASGAVWGVFFYAPTLFFEIRHNFILSRHIFSHGVLQQSSQSSARLSGFLNHLLPGPEPYGAWLLLILFVVTLMVGWWQLSRQKTDHEVLNQRVLFLITISVLVITTSLIIGLPITIHSHYIFGVLTFAFIALALLPLRVSALCLCVWCACWLSPTYLQKYFKPAEPLYTEIVRCMATVCANETSPLFTSVESMSHNHAGPEYRYLMGKLGCAGAPAVDTEPNATNLMAVVADQSVYEHGKTAYNELTLFGPSELMRTYHCGDTFKVHILQKK